MKSFIQISLFLCMAISAGAQYKTELYVAQDGSGDYTSIQEAIDNAKSFPDVRITIYIKNGLYKEKVKVHSWNNRITLKGESAANTIIRWGDHFDKIDRSRNSTFHTATLLVQGDDFRAENLTIENSAGQVGQAIAVSVEADRCVFLHCRMLGNQDTLYAAGSNARQYYKDCYVEGTTDFIFGAATAVFENCIIHSKANSYITAASTPEGRAFGFVFIECKLTAAPDVDSVYLGRPWRQYAKTVFVKCEMGNHIHPAGWDNWNSPVKEKTVFYAEYENNGPGAEKGKRVSWAKQLSKKEAKEFCTDHILKPFLVPDFKLD